MAKEMIVDEEMCIGCGVCAGLCPKSFELGENGKSKFIGEDDESCDQDTVIGSCPVGAIKIKE